MKKVYFYLGIALATCFSSCTEDVLDNGTVKNPVQKGDEILFGSTLTGDANVIEKSAESRTVYGDRTSTGVPVYWEKDGSDEIAIFCLQASQPENHLVNYQVMPETQDLDKDGKPDLYQASSVTKVDADEAGLQWGDPKTEHRFYAFYPARAVKGSAEEDATGQITANIPVTQQVQEWREGSFTSDDPKFIGKKCYFGLPNMDYAYMYAYKAVTPSQVENGKFIDLQFHNLVTVLDITIQGPSSGTAATITNINVEALTEEGAKPILTGDFTCNIRNTETGVVGTCDPVGSFSEERGRISIPCYDKKTGQFIQLKKDELLNVKAYIIPQDKNNTVTQRTLRVTVSLLNGAPCRKTLQQADVTPHKINRVILPPLTVGGTNYWMSSLDPDIYLSELSLPGSKMSVLTEKNGSDIVYQNSTIEQQFTDGVRAFILQTQRVNYSDRPVIDPKYRLEVYGGKGTVKTLKETLADIASYLKNAYEVEKKTNEYAFVLLTYQSEDGWFVEGKDWFNLLQNEINEIKDDPTYRIYTREITPYTTLGEVGGKIVLKANYNDADMISGNTNTAPMLYTLWETAYVPNGLDMTWGNPFNTAKLTWLYQEATAVKTGGSVDGNATYDEKIKYIKEIFQKSVDAYKNDDNHKTWFFNDLGGYYYEAHKSWGQTVVDRQDPVALASELNQLGISELQNRKENAGLGLIFMNYADKQENSGTLYKSDWLIQTIIDNNFKFALRKKESGTRTNYNAEYTNGGNAIGWDN